MFQESWQIYESYKQRRRGKGLCRKIRAKRNYIDKKSYFSLSESQTKLFDNLTLEIKEGQKVAVLGKIGSGKSSLVRVLLGLYIPDDGLVMVGGTNVNQIRPEDIRKNLLEFIEGV